MALPFLHYDVFTNQPFSGNQLAVFLDGRGLSTERMQAIAKEMNFSESTFILPAEADGTDVRMRIFTPGTELPMAGHPTIGSTFALAHSGVIKRGSPRFVFGLGVGPTPVDLEWNAGLASPKPPTGEGGPASPTPPAGESGLAFAWMTQLNPTFAHPVPDRDGAAAAIGLETSDLVADLPVQEVSCGVPYLLIPVRDRSSVDRAETDIAAYRKLIARGRLAADTCLYLFAGGLKASATDVPADGGATTYSRMFAPGFGIPEDPATGSAAGPLGCYLVRHGLLSGDAALGIVNQQGVKMGRPSRMHIAITEQGGQITEVKVGGEAVLVGRGELL